MKSLIFMIKNSQIFNFLISFINGKLNIGLKMIQMLKLKIYALNII